MSTRRCDPGGETEGRDEAARRVSFSSEPDLRKYAGNQGEGNFYFPPLT